jgi:hypothetical protein
MAETTKGMNLIHEVVNPQGLKTADLAVFIPSYDEADNIALPTKKMAAGLHKFYPNLTSVIINCDNNSCDGTRAAFFEAESEVPRIYVSTPPGLRGKGANVANMFHLAAELRARAVVMVDANLLSIKTTWIKSLADPILNGRAEYVSPLYVRHRYDSPISRGLAYPLLRTLFGRRVLQPICVEHAFSGRLNEIYRNRDWSIDDRGYKSDMRMLAAAVMNQAPVCQSFMAHPRISTIGSLDNDLPKAFGHVTRAIFDLMTETYDFWSQVKRSRPTILNGVDEPPVYPPPIVTVDRECLVGGFVDLGREFQEVWTEFFPAGIAEALKRELAVALNGGRPAMPVELWRGALYSAALAYKGSGPEIRRALVDSLCPPFLIKGLSVYDCSDGLDERQYNSLLEGEAISFEEGKADLVRAWAAQDQCREG